MFRNLASGQTIAYDHHGDDGAVPVVLLHGLSSNRTAYDPFIDALSSFPVGARKSQIFNIDMRGHGDSSSATVESYQASDYASDIAAFIESAGCGPAVVIGHSLGGLVAAELAASRPDLVRALVLEDPPLFEGDEMRRNASPVAAFFPKFVAAVVSLQARNAPPIDYEPYVRDTTPPSDLAQRCERLTKWDPMTMQAAHDGITWRGYDPKRSIACPLTILRADPTQGAVFTDDDAAAFSTSNGHAQIVLMTGATHSVRVTTPTAYLKAVEGFLATL
jgi:pimeloyl-ACP methyl ester carboxylesterase